MQNKKRALCFVLAAMLSLAMAGCNRNAEGYQDTEPGLALPASMKSIEVLQLNSHTGVSVIPVASDASTANQAQTVFAGTGLVVLNQSVPAVSAGGTDWPITKFYFFATDGSVLGSITGQDYTSIMQKYRVLGPTGFWDAPNGDGDWVKWFCDMFNEYRGLPTTSRIEAQTAQLEEYRLEVIRLTNLEREKVGLPPYEVSDRLMDKAQIRAEELFHDFSHTRTDGSYGGSENIARRHTSPDSVVEGWMNSEGHRSNILRPASSEGYVSLTHIGVGVYRSESGSLYWVQTFGHGPEAYRE